MNTPILDVAIGLIFIYLLSALICSVVLELIAGVLNSRARNLKQGIQFMLNDPTMSAMAASLYAHPRVVAFSQANRLPSYIPSAAFAEAIVDILDNSGRLQHPLEGPLSPFIRRAAGDLDRLRTDLANWFDQSMDRLSGYYKRRAQVMLLFIGLLLSGGLNINTLQITETLWSTPAIREALIEQASSYAAHADANAARPDFHSVETQFQGLPLPIGWKERCHPPWALTRSALYDWATLLAGWLITALAASLGTQFWFNTLQNALQLRAAGRKPDV